MRVPKIDPSVHGWKREALMLMQRAIMDKHITMRRMARAVRMKPNSLSNWFRGEGGPPFETFLKLALFLGASREDVDRVVYGTSPKFLYEEKKAG
jgi:transcriptional regulator with XRE-family HTH domain